LFQARRELAQKLDGFLESPGGVVNRGEVVQGDQGGWVFPSVLGISRKPVVFGLQHLKGGLLLVEVEQHLGAGDGHDAGEFPGALVVAQPLGQLPHRFHAPGQAADLRELHLQLKPLRLERLTEHHLRRIPELGDGQGVLRELVSATADQLCPDDEVTSGPGTDCVLGEQAE
jgi:hypothetical protein